MSKFIGTRLTLPNLATAPSSPAAGDAYYNTVTNTAYVYNGTSWVDLAASGGGSGDITDVVAGAGLTGGANTGSATLTVGAGTGITVNADDVAIDTTVVARKSDDLSVFAVSTSATIGVGSVNLGHASDTTLTRSAAGVLAVEGVDIVTTSGTQTLTNKTLTATQLTVSAQGEVRLADADSSNHVAIKAPATVSPNVTLTLPATAGSANQVLTTDGSGALSWSSVSTNLGTYAASTVTYDFGTPNEFSESYTNTQFIGNTTTIGIGGGGSVILAGAQKNTALTTKYWNTFNFATTRVANTAAVAFATAAVSPSPAGTFQTDTINGLDAQEAAATAVYWTEAWTQNTSGSAYASIRKYTTTLATSIWNAAVFGPTSGFSGWNVGNNVSLRAKFVSGPNNWIGGLYCTDSASTAQAFAVNDASGSVFKANFAVNSAGTSAWVITDVAYVPPVTGDGTVWAIGTGNIGGTATAYRRVAYTMNNGALTAASTASDWSPVGTAAGFSGLFWDSAATAIIWRSTDTYYGIDRTFGTQIFSSTSAYTNVRAQVRFGDYGFGAPTVSNNNTNSRVGVFGTAGSFYAPAKTDPTLDVPRPVLVGGTVVGFVEASANGVAGTAFSYLISRLRNDQEVVFGSASYGRLVYDTGTTPTLQTNRYIADDRITFGTGISYLPAGGSVVFGVTGGTTVSGTITRVVRTIDMK